MRRALLWLSLCACGPAPLVVPMLAENNSGQDGTATLAQQGQFLRVDIRVRAVNEPGEQQVHFHRGQCGEITGSVMRLEPGGASLALNPVGFASGSSPDGGWVESLNELKGVKLSDVNDGTWVINVHDTRDLALYTSCGNVR